jgi:hypothetical protein
VESRFTTLFLGKGDAMKSFVLALCLCVIAAVVAPKVAYATNCGGGGGVIVNSFGVVPAFVPQHRTFVQAVPVANFGHFGHVNQFNFIPANQHVFAARSNVNVNVRSRNVIQRAPVQRRSVNVVRSRQVIRH